MYDSRSHAKPCTASPTGLAFMLNEFCNDSFETKLKRNGIKYSHRYAAIGRLTGSPSIFQHGDKLAIGTSIDAQSSKHSPIVHTILRMNSFTLNFSKSFSESNRTYSEARNLSNTASTV